jgi:hypothetical protein
VPAGVGEEQRKHAGYALPFGDARHAPSEWALVCEGNLTPLHQVLFPVGWVRGSCPDGLCRTVVTIRVRTAVPSSGEGSQHSIETLSGLGYCLVLLRSDLCPFKEKLGTRCKETFQTHVIGLSEMSRYCAVPQCKQYSLCTSKRCTVLPCQLCSPVVHLRLLAGGTLIRLTLAF